MQLRDGRSRGKIPFTYPLHAVFGTQVKVENSLKRLIGPALSLVFAGATVVGSALQAHADVTTVTQSMNFHGLPGLIDMPTAEVAPDAELIFTFSDAGPNRRATMTFQATPRLTGSFRYTRMGALILPSGQPNYDRSLDFRFRLLNEGKYLPAVSVGINDLLGTGFFASEYIVATKSIGDRLRATAGLGWGRLGSYGAIGTPFGPRPVFNWGLGGTARMKTWFRGPVAPFGGLSFRVNERLTLKAEYSSDAYVNEVLWGGITRRSPFNFGIEYEILEGINFSLFSLYGSTIGAQFTVNLNPNRPVVRSGTEAAPLPVLPRPVLAANSEAWGTGWATDPSSESGIRSTLAGLLEQEGLTLVALSLGAHRAEVRFANHRFGAGAQAVGRVARAMTHALPASVEVFVITIVDHGIPISSVTLQRSDIEALEHAPAPEILARAVISDPAGQPNGLAPVPGLYPRFTWSLAPYTEFSLFAQDDPIAGEVGLRLSAQYEILPNLILSGAILKEIWGNLDEQTWVSTSPLPHVRTDMNLYAKFGDPAIEHLTLAWYGRPARNLYSRVTVGYLEPMFAGVSTELLWKPIDSNYALGAELNYVRQRAYNQLFGLRDYGVLTGHVTGYYSFDNGFDARLSVGRYLAGDYGATFRLDRVFENGWRVGGWVSLTSVSATQFGNGSFDKGIHFSIPLDWALGTPTRSTADLGLRQMERDGAAMLNVDGRLFDWVDQAHAESLGERWGRFWR
jgi:hypothetical protein